MFYTISYFTIKLSNLPKTKINILVVLWLSPLFVRVSFERTRYHTLIKTSKWNNEVTRNSLIINALHICIHILSPCITISSHTCNITAIIRHDLVIINNFFLHEYLMILNLFITQFQYKTNLSYLWVQGTKVKCRLSKTAHWNFDCILVKKKNGIGVLYVGIR